MSVSLLPSRAEEPRHRHWFSGLATVDELEIPTSHIFHVDKLILALEHSIFDVMNDIIEVHTRHSIFQVLLDKRAVSIVIIKGDPTRPLGNVKCANSVTVHWNLADNLHTLLRITWTCPRENRPFDPPARKEHLAITRTASPTLLLNHPVTKCAAAHWNCWLLLSICVYGLINLHTAHPLTTDSMSSTCIMQLSRDLSF